MTPQPASPRLKRLVTESELAAQRNKGESFGDLIGGLATLVAATSTVERLTDHELDRGTEIVLSYLEGTDTVGHLFAPHRPPPLSSVAADDARRFGQVVDRYYAHVDDWLARVVAEMDEEDTLVIVSDHGFTWGRDRPPVASGVHTPTAAWWHRPEGAFLAVGPGIRHTPQRRRLAVLEVAPILLALAGLPPSEEMTGEVPGWLLTPQRYDDPPSPGRVNYHSLLPRMAPPKIELPKEVKDEELAKLRALGYVDSNEQVAASEKPPSPVPTRPAVDRAKARTAPTSGSTTGPSSAKSATMSGLRGRSKRQSPWPLTTLSHTVIWPLLSWRSARGRQRFVRSKKVCSSTLNTNQSSRCSPS